MPEGVERRLEGKLALIYRGCEREGEYRLMCAMSLSVFWRRALTKLRSRARSIWAAGFPTDDDIMQSGDFPTPGVAVLLLL